jgi:hypothetical protein
MSQIERVSVDLETTGQDPGCGILCIGAITFDQRHKFYERISPESCRAHGLVDDIETMRWWAKQDHQLREEAFGGTKDLVVVLDEFHDWFRSIQGKDWEQTEIWSRGSDFDLPILKAAYRKVDRPVPWHRYKGRCQRTISELMPHIKSPPRASKKHHALDDAIYQAEHATLLLQVL